MNAIRKHAGLKNERDEICGSYREGESSYGAYVPDGPGCVAVGDPKAEVEKLIAEAIALHLESLSEQGEHIPEPSSQVEYIEPAQVA